jgi:hypothetical protein
MTCVLGGVVDGDLRMVRGGADADQRRHRQHD